MFCFVSFTLSFLTGMQINHSEFLGRARWGYSSPGLPDEDNHGHGTHCAGTLGGMIYGVAKDVELVAVKVINRYGGGSAEDFVDGKCYQERWSKIGLKRGVKACVRRGWQKLVKQLLRLII